MTSLFERYQYWNTTADERKQNHPADRHASSGAIHLVRALDVEAPAAVVFRWLCQLKVAPYSYDLVDNLGRRSPRTLTPGADDLAVGQRFAVFARIAQFEQDGFIVATSGPRGPFGQVAISYQVTPGLDTASRIVACIALPPGRGPLGRVKRDGLAVGDLVMMRKQLRNLGSLAEGTSSLPSRLPTHDDSGC